MRAVIFISVIILAAAYAGNDYFIAGSAKNIVLIWALFLIMDFIELSKRKEQK